MTTIALDGTYFKIVNAASGKCVDVAANGTANGTKVDQYACNGTSAQAFKFVAEWHEARRLSRRLVLVHALSERALAFYQCLGFDVSPLDPMILMVTLADLRASSP